MSKDSPRLIRRLALVSDIPIGPAQALFFRTWEYLAHAITHENQGIGHARVFNHPPGTRDSLRRLSTPLLARLYSSGTPIQAFNMCTRCWQTWERFWIFARNDKDALSESLIKMERHNSIGAAHYRVLLVGPMGLIPCTITGPDARKVRADLERMRDVFVSFSTLIDWWDVVAELYEIASSFTTWFRVGDTK